MYYRRDGKPYPGNDERQMLAWAKDFQKTELRRVAEDNLPNGVRVSTVWLGLDRSFLQRRPQIFESMAFMGTRDMDQWLYATEEEARLGHKMLVKKWRAYKTAKEILK